VTGQVKVHETSISVDQIAHTELDAGAEIELRVKLSCSDFCNLRGKTVNIIAPDETVTELSLTGFNGAENTADDFVVKVPDTAGSYAWTAVFPEQEDDGISHLESSAPFSFAFKPHGIGTAVWDVPLPVVVNTKFAPKIGVRCSAGCNLTGKTIEIYDHEGGKVATGTLGGVPWPDTDALYWVELELEAPGVEGYYEWSVRFPEPDLEPPHQAVSYTLGFATARPPEHRVTVEVLDKDTQTPIVNAAVVLHPYSGRTDQRGFVAIAVPKGHYDIYISESGKKVFRTPVDVAGDVATKAELLTVAPDLEMS
jgi:hypothetical protein